MRGRLMRYAWLLLALPLAAWTTSAAEPSETSLRFEVTAARGLLKDRRDGRVLVVLGRDGRSEPRQSIGGTGLEVPPMLGADGDAFGDGATVVLDRKSVIFPLGRLEDLPAGTYRAQAVFHHNR